MLVSLWNTKCDTWLLESGFLLVCLDLNWQLITLTELLNMMMGSPGLFQRMWQSHRKPADSPKLRSEVRSKGRLVNFLTA